MKKRILEPGYIRLNYIVIDSESSEELENKVSNFRRENDGAILGNLAVVGNVEKKLHFYQFLYFEELE